MMPIPPDIQSLITSALGPGVSSSTVDVRGRAYEVIEARSPRSVVDWLHPAMAQLHASDVRLYFGEGGGALKAIWQLPPLDVIEVEQVGNHNGASDYWQSVRALVEEVAGGDSFDVVFADSAGLDIRFAAPLSIERARAAAGLLLERSTPGGISFIDSYLFMVDESDGLTPDPDPPEDVDGHVVAYIARGRLRLWWD